MATDKNELGPIEVEVRDGQINQALKVLQKAIGKEGIIQKMKEKQHYTKPSKKRHDRRRKKERERRMKREEQEE